MVDVVALVVVGGLAAVLDAVVDVAVRVEGAEVVGFVAVVGFEDTVLGREVVVLFSAVAELATLARRSRVDVVDLVGALVAVPARDMRFADPEIPRFSSLELATERPFSSAELLIEARGR